MLTAAHCVAPAPDELLTVRTGEWDTRGHLAPGERGLHQDRSVSRSVIHPRYDASAVRNDIALLFLETDDDAAHLQPQPMHIACVCLPPAAHAFRAGQRCFASGWGKNASGAAGRYQTIMKRVEVPLVGRAECERVLRQRTKLGRWFRLHRSFLCAGGEFGRDACRGDGGAPLVCPGGRYDGGDDDAGGVDDEEVDDEHDADEAAINDNGSSAQSPAAMMMLRSGFFNNNNDAGGASRWIRTNNRQQRSQQPFYYQAGIVAWGAGCNERVPAAYVKVAHFRRWIDREVRLRGWDTAYYTAHSDDANDDDAV